MDEARPMLDYSTPPKRARLPFKLFNMLTVLSLIGGAAILFLSALGWECSLNLPSAVGRMSLILFTTTV